MLLIWLQIVEVTFGIIIILILVRTQVFGTQTAQGNTDGNGIGDFYYSPPSGHLALCATNLPQPTIGPNSYTS